MSAYLYLLTKVHHTHVVLSGDSAGGGLCLAMLQIIRDQGLPMPAGASLISPWVDLTHTFPSIVRKDNGDYVPSFGFHARPSLSWPPPTPDEMRVLGIKRNPHMGDDYVIELDGQPYTITDQINLYAPNLLLPLPMCSPIYAATLGGFCPCQVITGDAEVLRDEQVFLAQKMSNPGAFPPQEVLRRYSHERLEDLGRYPPTDVQHLIFDEGPHAAPTLGYIDIAKHQYRAISSFLAWALSRAQDGADVEIEDHHQDGYVTPPEPPTVGGQTAAGDAGGARAQRQQQQQQQEEKLYVGLRAGDTLPPFRDHMVRYRVDRQGRLYEAEAPELMPALQMPLEEVGYPRGNTLRGWIKYKEKMDIKFASDKKKIFEKRMAQAQRGFISMPEGEYPPPTALAGRRVVGDKAEVEGSAGGLGNSILSKLLSRLEGGGPAAEKGRKDSMQGGEGGEGGDDDDDDDEGGGGQRSSRIIRSGPQGVPPGRQRDQKQLSWNQGSRMSQGVA